jgi:hypothetical protein
MRLCGQCAAPLGAACPFCGAANPPENRLCGSCAAPLDSYRSPGFAEAVPEMPVFPLRLLGAVWKGAESLEDQLRELTRLEFVHERIEAAGSVYVFRHALTQETAYGSLPERNRRIYIAPSDMHLRNSTATVSTRWRNFGPAVICKLREAT